MSERVACTIAAPEQWASARVVARSFAEHHRAVPFVALLVDDPDGEHDVGSEPFEVVRLSEIEVADRAGLESRYTRQELSYAVTPDLIAHLLGRGHDRVVFIKAESLVTAELTELWSLLETHDIVLTPHRLGPLGGADAAALELQILLAGGFNGGILGVADRPQGRAFVDWWRDRLRENCVHAVAEGMHFEQRWLDLVPAYFDRTAIVRDPGCNVGHWNLDERDLHLDAGVRVMAGDGPCSLVRFSGYDPHEPERVSRYKQLDLSEIGAAADVWRLYRERLLAEGTERR